MNVIHVLYESSRKHGKSNIAELLYVMENAITNYSIDTTRSIASMKVLSILISLSLSLIVLLPILLITASLVFNYIGEIFNILMIAPLSSEKDIFIKIIGCITNTIMFLMIINFITWVVVTALATILSINDCIISINFLKSFKDKKISEMIWLCKKLKHELEHQL